MSLKEGKTVIKDVKREQELTLIHRINNSHACMTPRALITATKYKLVILVGIVLLCRPTKPWQNFPYLYTQTYHMSRRTQANFSGVVEYRELLSA